LQLALAGCGDLLIGETGRVELFQLDPHQPDRAVLIQQAGADWGLVEGVAAIDVRGDDLTGVAIRDDQLREGTVQDPGGMPRLCVAAPVHEHGRTFGSLVITSDRGEQSVPFEYEDLLAFADHISLALTDAKSQREKDEAMRDAVTGLASRALFHTQLREALADEQRIQPVALLFIDLDRFKAVNDTLGHAAGDALLSHVGQILRTCTRPTDLVGRLGGDEFVVALSDAAEHDALEVAVRIIERVCELVPLPGGCAEIGASVGVAISGSNRDEEELVRRADIAMYHAKRAGRGRVVVYEEAMDPTRLVVANAANVR